MAHTSGSLLLRAGIISKAQLAEAQKLQLREGGSFGECLVRAGAIDEAKLVEFYHHRMMIPRIADDKLQRIAPAVLATVPGDMAVEFRVCPVELDAEGLTLAMADPSDNHAVDELGFFADKYILRAVASESAVRAAIETHYKVKLRVLPAGAAGKTAVIAEEPLPLTKVKQAAAPKAEEAPILLTKTIVPANGSVAAPSPPLEALRAASGREQVGQVVLDYVSQLTERAIYFVSNKGYLVGFDARGARTDAASAKKLSVRVDTANIFRDVVSSRLPYRGPLPASSANRALADALGGVAAEILVMPIAIGERTVAVLFADGMVAQLPDSAVQSTMREAGLAYERLLRKSAR